MSSKIALCRKKILIVDDDESVREMLESILSAQGEIFKAASGEKGLEILGREDIDVVVLDLHLPGINGIEVLERIKSSEKIKDVPAVIILTVVNDSEMTMKCLHKSAYWYLLKENIFEIEFMMKRALHFVERCREYPDFDR